MNTDSKGTNSGPRKPKRDSKDTSWNVVSQWYDEHLQNEDTYQNKVILPHVSRLLADLKGESLQSKAPRIIDIACGQGFFAYALAQEGFNVYGVDASKELIERARAIAEKQKTSGGKTGTKNLPTFDVRKSDHLLEVPSGAYDAGLIISAIQNIEEVGGTFAEAKRVLKHDGKLIIVMNHPAFRVPQHSDWVYSETTKKQSRAVDMYLSEKRIDIVMNPGAPAHKQVTTPSFHRSLQYYSKMLMKHGFAIAKIEEWNSHKESGKGPRKEAEDVARKEIPLFMMIQAEQIK